MVEESEELSASVGGTASSTVHLGHRTHNANLEQ